MAQFNTPQSPNNMRTPDDRTLSAEFQENKLENQKNIALDVVESAAEFGGADEFFEHDSNDVTVDGFKGLGRLNRVQDVTRAVNHRVLSMLSLSSAENIGTNNRISSDGNIDRNIWNSVSSNNFGLRNIVSRVSHRAAEDRINTVFENANYSESVLTGYGQLVDAAETKFKSERERVNAEQQECLDRKRLIGRALDNPVCNALRISNLHSSALRWFKGSRVGKPLRAIFSKKARYERFQEKFDDKLTERFSSIKEKLTKEKEKATKRKEQMKSRISRTFKNVTDIEDKNELWNAVEGAALNNNGGNFDAALLGRFNISTNRRHVQNNSVLFWEALQDLPELKESIFAISASREKYRTQNEILQSAETQENDLRNDIGTTINFQSLVSDINGEHIPAASPAPDKKALIANLEADFQRQGRNLHTDIYGGLLSYSRLDMLTPSMKLAQMVHYLNQNRAILSTQLSNQSLSELRGWIEQEGKKVVGRIEEYNNGNATTLNDSLFDSNAVGNVPTGLVNRLQYDVTNLPRIFGTIESDILRNGIRVNTYRNLDDLRDRIQNNLNTINSGLRDLLRNEPHLPKKDKEHFEGIVKLFEEANSEVQSFSTQVRLHSQRLASYRTSLATQELAVESAENTVSNYTGNSANQISANERALTSARTLLSNKQAQPPVISNVSDFSNISTQLNSLINSGFRLEGTLNSASNTDINSVIKQALLKDFSTEVEERYLKHLEANDQYTDLEKCSEGMNVKISYCEVSGIDDLHMPQQIHENNNNHREAEFRILKKIKNEDGTTSVMLTSRNTPRKIITINSGSVTNGKLNKNGIIQESSVNSTPGSQRPTNPMHGGAGHHIFAYNFQIGQ